MHIGFIGLGHMGLPMALNLLKKGHTLSVYDLNPDPVKECEAAGAIVCESLLETIQDQDIVITMLPEGKHVKSVYIDADLFNHASQKTIFIDCSTIDIETSQLIHEVAESTEHRLLDAPVSGGVKGAEAGTLTFMVGGKEEDFLAVKPLLEAMGTNIFHAGEATHGQAAKICNNLMLAIHMIGTSEAFNLAEKLGLDARKLFEIASVSSGQSWSLTSYAPVPGLMASPASNDYKAGFAAKMMLKDLKLATDAAKRSDTFLPLGSKAEVLYEKLCATEGERDFSAILCYLKESGN